MKDDPEFNISFVSMVQQFPCLYDSTSLDYSNKTLQLKAWETIASQVNESVLDCKDRWKNLRGCFTRHLKNKSGEASGHRYRKPYYLAQHLNFLLPFTKSRLLVSNEPSEGFQNEDDDTVVDDDGDDNNNYNAGEDTPGEEGMEEPDDGNHEERTDGDDGRGPPAKRGVKPEPFADGGGGSSKWTSGNCVGKRMRLERQSSDDSDLLFLKSLLPDMRAMDGSQKRRLKIGILQLCDDILNEATFRT